MATLAVMAISIRTYTIKEDGTKTPARIMYRGDGGPPLITSIMPPCECPRCRQANHESTTGKGAHEHRHDCA
jgi:hypothetical protein